MVAAREPRIRGNWVLMAKVRMNPGWAAVQAQALDCGMVAKAEEKLHVTVLFMGENMVASRADRVRQALAETMQELTDAWRAGVESGRFRVPGRLAGGDIPRAFIPFRFPGAIGQFLNKGGTSVHAVVEPSPALLSFRSSLQRRLGFDVRQGFGGYKPHVTLAEGPPGSSLRRGAEVPAAITNSSTLVLKIGDDIREEYVLG